MLAVDVKEGRSTVASMALVSLPLLSSCCLPRTLQILHGGVGGVGRWRVATAGLLTRPCFLSKETPQ